MQDPNDKLDISAISFDDMLGDGLETAPQDVEETTPDDVQEPEELEEEVTASDPRERGDEDYEDNVDEDYDEQDNESLTVEDELPIANQISDVLGLELEAEYDDTVEGLTNFVRDMSQEVAEDQLQSLFEEYPEVQRHLDFILAGGDPEQFYATNSPQSDYGNIQMSEQDITLQRAMLGEYFKAKGHQDDFIVDMLNDYEESGKLYGKAVAAQEQLSIAQQEQKETLYQQQLASKEEAEAEQNEFWEAVATTIEDGNEFAGIRIPDNDKQEFFDYISAPVDDQGNTQRDLDYSEANMDIKLAIDYLMYSGFNLGDIIDTKARTKSVENLRSRIQNNEERVKSARKASRRQKTFDPDKLDINALF
jgi:RNA recognition motif-containing protein|tara:strand:- start:965 stop:2056 length:1092 start_codon:yes stop_codon:yes gene_type:complete